MEKEIKLGDFTFKNKKERMAFIVMNIFGGPLSWIVAYLLLSWYGVIGSVVIFIVSYLLYKYYGKHKGSLSFNPSISFGNKRFGLFKNE